ncbi:MULTISPECIES: glutathione S-transferase family protein [Rhizobium]|uniref:glutathione S-transferase family protein n=1 Tax=Rhizobium TaxID=379 RepID=UPI0007EA3D1D|nr:MULTISPECIES: glutathione S-transferase family protein [Rhizobium]ANK85969.1 glutathione S-transferase protein [Rhizobium sp. N731]ANK91878.1 glutathione S-transferase protein [Rhizobium sp. N6212]ANK97912.1 glutathione S-transferase protein [Rhizobium sp. N621]ANL03991.1 glutathione S-transferase protein [Rhizobium esperanzae]ANL10037.1 glutathione S-transferase protein [Rhizobium sp. N1341]
MAEELVFYTNPMSRGRIARWMLEEIGQPYRTELLTFGESMKAPEYLRVNPMGKVPAIRHGNTVVTECAAICAYLAETFPEKGLAPRPEERASYYRWMFFAAGPLESAVTMKALGFEIPTERLRMAGCGGFGDVMNTLEMAVSGSTYVTGERFTAADVYVGAHIGWGLGFGSIEKRQAFVDYFGRVSERDAYKRANALDDEAGKTMQAA